MGFAHGVQHVAHAVLRGYLQLAADVVLHQVGEELPLGVFEQVVKPDPRADEHLLHPGDGPELPQQGQVVAVVGVQVGAGGGGQAVPLLAQAVLQLLLAGGPPEVGGGAAHVVDVPLEPWVLGEGGDLPDEALVAAGGDHPPLVEGQGAELAGPEAPPVVDDGEAHLLNGGHAPHAVVHRVGLPHVGQLCHLVQLLGVQGHGGGIADEVPVPVGLDHRPAPDGVVLVVFHQVGLGIGPLAPAHFLKGGHRHRREPAGRRVPGQEAGALDAGEFLHWGAGGQGGGNLPGGPLPHAVGEQVGLGV